MTRHAAILGVLLVLAVPLPAQTAADRALPAWTQQGVCYEVFVRSFYDGDGDGTGDLRGLIQKLDYINDGNPQTQNDLGASCIWLMPIAQSPSYHGYDVTNYYQVNRDYGTNEDFKQLMAEAHRRGIAVLVDLVLNHSSSDHPFFRSALLSATSPYRDWYRWSPTVRPAPGWQGTVWHKVPARDEYYYGLFWSGMPDLNLANPAVRAEAENIARFWLTDMDADGFRLDAVAHFFEGPAGEWRNVPAVHPWLRDYAAALRRIKPDVFTIGEVYDSLGAALSYYPDQLDSFFAFEIADAIIDAVRSGSSQHLVSTVQRAQRDIPDGRWGIFLRNHDQTRTLSELQGDVARNKLAATLSLTLPGLPFIYYGEEIGMTGMKPAGDIRLRTPMQWSRRSAAGFTRGTPWEPLPADSFTANVEAEDADPASLLNHYRRLIRLRSSSPALAASAQFIPLTASLSGAMAYLRHSSGGVMLVVANLGSQSLTNLVLSSSSAVLPAGRYRAISRLTPGETLSLRVPSGGRVQWRVPTLAPFQAMVLELSR